MPRKPRKSRESKAVIEVVSGVLFERWDPMGVRAQDARWPRDEYEGYAAGILELIDHAASDDVVAEHLARLEGAWMGLDPPSPLEHRLTVAAELRAAVRAVRGRGASG
ncbi:MAG: hypothetical protein ABR499_01605 [Gemmatimonadaceae bacterium]